MSPTDSDRVAIRGLYARLYFRPLDAWHRLPGSPYLALQYYEGEYVSSFDLYSDPECTILIAQDLDALDADPAFMAELLAAPPVRTPASEALTNELKALCLAHATAVASGPRSELAELGVV